jgi:hypothetical protein
MPWSCLINILMGAMWFVSLFLFVIYFVVIKIKKFNGTGRKYYQLCVCKLKHLLQKKKQWQKPMRISLRQKIFIRQLQGGKGWNTNIMFNPATFLGLYQVRTWIFNTICHGLFCAKHAILRVRAELRISTMRLPADYYFNKLALWKFN